MKSRLKILGIAVAAAMCAAPMVGPGVAQENAQASDASKAGSGAGPGGSGAINSGADAKSSDGGDRGAGQGRLREGDAVRSGSPVQAGPGSDANRKGVRAPAGGVSTPPGQQDVTLDRGINPVRLEGGLAGLQ